MTSSSATPSVSPLLATAVVGYLSSLEVPVARLASHLHVHQSELVFNNRVPLTTYERLLEAGEALTGDAYFGLNMGLAPQPKTWGLVSHLAVSAPNAMAAASALMNYSELQLDFLRFERVESTHDTLALEWVHPRVPRLNPHVAEHLLANIVTLATSQVGYVLPDLRLRLQHERPAVDHPIAAALNADVRFSCASYRIEVSLDFLRQQAAEGESDFHQVSQRLAELRLMELREADPFLARVRATVLQKLPMGLPKLNDVAAALELSGRSLQRRLAERQLRYQKVLDEVRQELAHQLLEDESLSLNDVADYLGFNDQSAMHSAVKRWEDMTPGALRRRLQLLAGTKD